MAVSPLQVCAGYRLDINRQLVQVWLELDHSGRALKLGAPLITYPEVVAGATPGMRYRFLVSEDGEQIGIDADEPPLPMGVYPDTSQITAWMKETIQAVMTCLGEMFTALNEPRRQEFKLLLLDYLERLEMEAGTR